MARWICRPKRGPKLYHDFLEYYHMLGTILSYSRRRVILSQIVFLAFLVQIGHNIILLQYSYYFTFYTLSTIELFSR